LIGDDPVKKAKAEKARYIELVRFLVARGADVKVRTAAGETPLSMARAQHQEEGAALLLAAGARK
jgi:ankyrin repeat protein